MFNNYTNNMQVARPTSEAISDYMQRVFTLMAIGLGVTGLLAFVTLQVEPLLVLSLKLRWALLIGELVMVLVLAAKVFKMDPRKAMMWFYIYAGLNGITLTPIFLVYTHSAIYNAFFITAGTFGGMAMWGYSTKKDLSSLGSILVMGLWGIILASVVNLFIGNSGFQLILSYACVGIFVGLTAWDVQKLKNLAMSGQMTGGVAVMGALQLYLDFINLFLNILFILGGKRD